MSIYIVILSYLSQLRVGLSKLNFHKFEHNFKDTLNTLCPTNDAIEDTEHFLLLCPSFDVQRRDLLTEISQLLQPFVHINNLSNTVLIKLLLYGDKDFSDSIAVRVIEAWRRCLDSSGIVGTILMDLLKAYDRIPHELLIAKLEAYGFHEKSLRLMYSYLTNRKQGVKIGCNKSSQSKVKIAIPQGSTYTI